MSLSRIITQRSDIAWKDVDGTAVLMDVSVNKQVHRLNSVGTFIWKNLDGHHSLSEILDLLCLEFDVNKEVAEQDLNTLIDKLHDLGVVNGA